MSTRTAPQLRRRRVLGLLLGGASLPLLPAGAAAAPTIAGCCLKHGQAQRFHAWQGYRDPMSQVMESSGDEALDRLLGRALVKLSALFGQRPGFGFIDDWDSPNAYATADTLVPGTWGTVLYGSTLFRQTLAAYDDGGMAVMCILAHEFGHIAQYAYGLEQRLLWGQGTVRRVELHADFLAGYYLARRKAEQPELVLWAAGDMLFRIGDYAFNDWNHHGTPEQRVAAAEAGFRLGADQAPAFDPAVEQGVEWVLRNV